MDREVATKLGSELEEAKSNLEEAAKEAAVRAANEAARSNEVVAKLMSRLQEGQVGGHLEEVVKPVSIACGVKHESSWLRSPPSPHLPSSPLPPSPFPPLPLPLPPSTPLTSPLSPTVIGSQ